MYRILLVVLLNVAISLGCRPPPCHWSDSKPALNYFETVARKVINADRKAQNFCIKQGSSNIVEEHTETEYKLIIPGAGAATYDVKVHHRAVLIISENCQNSVTEVKILPPYVNGYGGYYYIDNNALGIAFPYKYDPTVGGGSCDDINRAVYTLYQGTCRDCTNIG